MVRLHDGSRRTDCRRAQQGRTQCATPNGLGRPSLHDNEVAGVQGYRITDWAYAGDMLGNVWKFDLTSSNPANWGVAFGGNTPAPLFHARTNTGSSGVPLPITGTIEIGVAPPNVAAGSSKPAMLWFGTGRYFAVDDRIDTTTQTMFGILDRGGNSAINSSTGNSAGDRSMLVAQTRAFGANNTGTVSANAVDYLANGNSRKEGWYINLTPPSGTPAKGERMVGLPLIQFGRLIIPTHHPGRRQMRRWRHLVPFFAVDPLHRGGALPGTKKFFLGSYLGTSFLSADFIGSTVGVVRNLVYIGTGSRGLPLRQWGRASNVPRSRSRSATQHPDKAPSEAAPRGARSSSEVRRRRSRAYARAAFGRLHADRGDDRGRGDRDHRRDRDPKLSGLHRAQQTRGGAAGAAGSVAVSGAQLHVGRLL